MNRYSSLTILALALLVGTTSVVYASVFPDVPDGHLFQREIEELVRSGVVNGNPDGTFDPDAPVNRAAMLKMLYLAKGRTPDPLSTKCASDVEVGAWYESYVCDAYLRGDVKGYANGTFGPEKAVNRVEALKMIVKVFGIPLDEVTNENREVVNFADVSLSAWYTQYLLTAYTRKVLPIPGQTGAYFYPDQPLTRGEAAAMIYNAMHADLSIRRQEAEPSSTSSSSSVFSSTQVSQQASQAESSDGTTTGEYAVPFPFDREGKFSAKQTVSYKFEIGSRETISVEASLQSGQPGQITCRLYLVEESGFSDEYFLGYQEGSTCYLTSTLNPGTYQLQLAPTQKDTTFMIEAETAIGDGNDGFADAMLINANQERTDVIGSGDFEDWFRFSLQSEQTMTVSLGNPTELRCIVYAMSDVDLQSFSGPQCNQSYAYPPGTYYIAIGRKAPKVAQQTYTIELEK